MNFSSTNLVKFKKLLQEMENQTNLNEGKFNSSDDKSFEDNIGAGQNEMNKLWEPYKMRLRKVWKSFEVRKRHIWELGRNKRDRPDSNFFFFFLSRNSTVDLEVWLGSTVGTELFIDFAVVCWVAGFSFKAKALTFKIFSEVRFLWGYLCGITFFCQRHSLPVFP